MQLKCRMLLFVEFSFFLSYKQTFIQVDVESLGFTSKLSISSRKEKPQMVRPMSRKDIFYSGSVLNLPEYKSQKSLSNYRQSILSLPQLKVEDEGSRRYSFFLNMRMGVVKETQDLCWSPFFL